MVKRRILSITLLNLRIVHELFINKKGITIKKLAENIKTDYKNTYNAVDFLFKEGIIKKEKVGNYNVCRLNYDSDDLLEYLKEYNFYVKVKEFRKKYPTEYQIIMEVCGQLQKDKGTNPFFVCLIFGSYARNEEKEGSDMDVLFLKPTSYENEREIRKILTKINAPYQKKFHLLGQDINKFIKDLKKMEELSIANEIYKEPPIVFYGDDAFFRIMVEANKLW